MWRGFSCAAPPLKFFEVHAPAATRVLADGDMVFDLGQNAAHVPRICVTGPAGSKVRLIPSELLDDDGEANQGSMGAGHRGDIWCEFTKATGGADKWETQSCDVSGAKGVHDLVLKFTGGHEPLFDFDWWKFE